MMPQRDLYIGGAGIKPNTTLPICLDLGTNTDKFLTDPLYLGVRRRRPDTPEMDAFMHEFMEAMAEVFPQLLVQFEDFSTDNAFRYLDMFRNQYRSFNDDVGLPFCSLRWGMLIVFRLDSGNGLCRSFRLYQCCQACFRRVWQAID